MVFIEIYNSTAINLFEYRAFIPRYTPSFLNKNKNSIAEITSIPVNGVDQGLLLRGENIDNPVLRFIHGGPGTGQIGIMRKYQSILEKHFIMVQWDQRGAGISEVSSDELNTLNKEQYISDGLDVTKYLKKRFNKEKIFIVGHSWGSGLGYTLAHRYPEHYHAFAGIGQMSPDAEILAYAATMKAAKESNNTEGIVELEKLGAPPYKEIIHSEGMLHASEDPAIAGMLVRYKWSEILGGDAKRIKISNVFIKDLFFSTEYQLKDVFSWLGNKGISLNQAYNECIRDLDLFAEGTDMEVSVYFFLGDNDMLAVPSGAIELFEQITAPRKEIVWFDGSSFNYVGTN